MTTLHVAGLGSSATIDITGARESELVAAVREAWTRCLVDDPLPDSGTVEVTLASDDDLATAMVRLTQSVTRELIRAQAGRLLMFHAGAVCNPETGDSLVYVAPGGTGKTTLSKLLGADHGYLTDETVGVDAAGVIWPYPKPLSIRPRDADGPKLETSPDEFGLLPAHPRPRVRRVILLDRADDQHAPEATDLGVLDAIAALAPESSSLSKLDRPLRRVTELLESTGHSVRRYRYAEAADLLPELRTMIGTS